MPDSSGGKTGGGSHEIETPDQEETGPTPSDGGKTGGGSHEIETVVIKVAEIIKACGKTGGGSHEIETTQRSNAP